MIDLYQAQLDKMDEEEILLAVESWVTLLERRTYTPVEAHRARLAVQHAVKHTNYPEKDLMLAFLFLMNVLYPEVEGNDEGN
jgi:hypothetical protein